MENIELKVVIHLWGERTLVGIQQKDCDPVVELIQTSTLETVLAAIPALVARAQEHWAQSPRNPKYDGPPLAPSPAPPPAAPTSRGRETATTRAGAPQTPMF